VTRYEVDGLGTLNFVSQEALGGGVSRSLCLDNYGKALSSLVLGLRARHPRRAPRQAARPLKPVPASNLARIPSHDPDARIEVDSPHARAQLERFLAGQAGARKVAIEHIELLSGGTIQENWALDVALHEGPMAGRHQWVLRTGSPAAIAVSLTRAQEFTVLRVAHGAGVAAPRPLWMCDDPAFIGREFFVMERIAGLAAGHRLTREPELVPDAVALAESLGENMGRLHTIRPPRAELGFLPLPRGSSALAAVSAYREYLDRIDAAHPVLDWGLRWCELNSPSTGEIRLIHRDYRTGNYMVHDGKLTGVLDWEFAGWGDPREDIGWFMARCWRFAGDGTRRAESPLPRTSCADTNARRDGATTRLNSGTGRSWRTCAGRSSPCSRRTATSPARNPRSNSRSPATWCPSSSARSLPSPVEAPLSKRLGDTLRTASEALVASILPTLGGPARYHGLMVARVLAIGAREAESGAQAERQELAGIEMLVPEAARADAGEGSDPEAFLHRHRRALCSEIRNGRFDAAGPGQDALLEHLAVTTENRLRINNPKILGP
jgi:aminoglycoside phosphotransferase (APT) family kinase protein